MVNVQFQRPDYENLRVQYDIIEDCLKGEIAVKYRGIQYLPMPNAADTSDVNMLRYDAYRGRAVFYNVTRRTISGLVGLVFTREPAVELPTVMEALEDNADGGGVNLVQIAKDALWHAIAYGKTAILVDFPHADEPVTIADVNKFGIAPTLTVYHPKNIINWRTAVVGGKKKLTLAVLVESQLEQGDDEFTMRDLIQYRVLRLIDGVYTQQVYANGGTEEGPIITPLDGNGNPFDTIPLFPIGSETNTMAPTAPPAYDLATINLAHYRNSADYEESVYIVGQPTLAVTGLTETWVKDVFSNGVVEMGSRAAIPLPVGGDAKILQAAPNMIAKEAMEAKEAQMVALGARLVKDSTKEKTATQSNIDQTNADSVLATCAQNVKDGIVEALKFAAKFTNADENAILFDLNTEFDLTKLSPEDIKSLIALIQANLIALSEARESLTRGGIATLDFDEFKKEMSEDVALAAENATTMMEATTPPEPAVGGNV